MTKAEEVLDILACFHHSAYTLGGGYAISVHGERRLFEPATITDEKRNKAERLTKCKATYKDGSVLLFAWSEANGSSLNLPRHKKLWL